MIINKDNIIESSYVFNESKKYTLDLSSVFDELNFSFSKGTKIELLITNFESNKINFFLQKYVELDVKIINNGKDKELDFKENLDEESSIKFYFADFCASSIFLRNNCVLYGNSSKFYFNLTSLCNKDNKKYYEISCNHIGRSTISDFASFGVCLKNGEIKINGVSHIEKNSFKSSANQKAKVILFDKESKAIASPALKIDCDDIKASHGAAIGSLNEEHVFYLMSRGIKQKDARKLITYGYLLPIKAYFSNEGQKYIDEEINRGFEND